MKYYEQLIDESVFGYPALTEIISENRNTIYSLIRKYLQKHYGEQVKKGFHKIHTDLLPELYALRDNLIMFFLMVIDKPLYIRRSDLCTTA